MFLEEENRENKGMCCEDGSQLTESTSESYSYMKQMNMCDPLLASMEHQKQMPSFHYRADAYDGQE